MKIRFTPSINDKERKLLWTMNTMRTHGTLICRGNQFLCFMIDGDYRCKVESKVKYRSDLNNLMSQGLIKEIEHDKPEEYTHSYRLTNRGWHILEILRLVDYINDIKDYKEMRCGDTP